MSHLQIYDIQVGQGFAHVWQLWGHPVELDLADLSRILGPEFALIMLKIASPFLLAITLTFLMGQDAESRAVHCESCFWPWPLSD